MGHGAKECIYHLLRAAFGQCVPIAQIVDLNVFDIVTILRVDLVVERAACVGLGGRLVRARTCTWALDLRGQGQLRPLSG